MDKVTFCENSIKGIFFCGLFFFKVFAVFPLGVLYPEHSQFAFEYFLNKLIDFLNVAVPVKPKMEFHTELKNPKVDILYDSVCIEVASAGFFMAVGGGAGWYFLQYISTILLPSEAGRGARGALGGILCSIHFCFR